MQNLEIFFRKNRDRHLNTIFKIIHDYETAEDIVQDAYMRAVKYHHTYNKKRSSFNTWFNKILFNTLRTYQKEYKLSLDISDFDVEMCPNGDVFDFNVNYSKSLEEKIDTVDNERHRKILVLFFVLGYSSREIAEIENTSTTNVTTICNRFKNRVKS